MYKRQAHAYGTNGIIAEVEMPLAASYDWIELVVGFDGFAAAASYANALGEEDGLLTKLITVIAPIRFPTSISCVIAASCRKARVLR